MWLLHTTPHACPLLPTLQLTFLTAAHPKLANATVQLIDATGTTVAEGKTGVDGLVTLDASEGLYLLQVGGEGWDRQGWPAPHCGEASCRMACWKLAQLLWGCSVAQPSAQPLVTALAHPPPSSSHAHTPRHSPLPFAAPARSRRQDTPWCSSSNACWAPPARCRSSCPSKPSPYPSPLHQRLTQK